MGANVLKTNLYSARRLAQSFSNPPEQVWVENPGSRVPSSGRSDQKLCPGANHAVLNRLWQFFHLLE